MTISATASSGLVVTFSSATPLVCSVSGTSVTLLHAGTCTIDADQAGNATYDAAPRVSQPFAIGMGDQTISFSGPSAKTLLDSPVTISATASSGLVVTFSSATPLRLQRLRDLGHPAHDRHLHDRRRPGRQR